MKNIFLGSLVAIILVSIGACSKYDPIYGVAEFGNQEIYTLKKDLVYIYKNDVYLVNEILSDSRRLTNSPTSTKTHVVINHKHSKIAYLNANKTPVIIDSLGHLVETLPYTNVTDMKWVRNNGNPTLVILWNNTLVVHGPSLALPTNPFGYVFPSDTTFVAIDAFDINENLDIAFSFRYQRPYSLTSSYRYYHYGVAMNYKSSSSSDRMISYNEGYYNPVTTPYSNLTYNYFYMVNFNSFNSSASIGRVANTRQNDYIYYQLYSYNYTSSSSTLNSLNTALSYETYYKANSFGNVTANVYTIQKYLAVLPNGVPPPTGTANTFTLDFTSQNSSVPTYFDWNP